jgi:hypothetical protein
MSKNLRARRPRTSLIDAEWDWIANRFAERDGRWTIASAVNPSLARIAYAPAPTQRLLELQLQQAPPEPSRTLKSADLAPSAPAAAVRGGPSLLAVLLTATLGLGAGALLFRVGSSLGEPELQSPVAAVGLLASDDAPRAPAVSTQVDVVSAAPRANTLPATSARQYQWGTSLGRQRSRPRTALAATARSRPPTQSDNPY